MTHVHQTIESNDTSTPTPTDRITNLPEEILHHILSFLPIKQSVLTSILSNKWRRLWTFTPNLNFDKLPPPTIYRCLLHYNRLTITTLTIDLRSYSKQPTTPSDLDNWIHFATTRNVLNLTLLSSHPLSLPRTLYYHPRLQDLKLRSFVIDLPSNFKPFSSLKSLDLWNVRVSDQTITTLLITSPIEKLCLRYCHDLLKINISVPNLHLKFLEVHKCALLNELVLNAPNLISFKASSSKTDTFVCLKNVSSLQAANVDVSRSSQFKPSVVSMCHVSLLGAFGCFPQFIFTQYCHSKSPLTMFVNLKEFYYYGTLDFPNAMKATLPADCPVCDKNFTQMLKYHRMVR